ncbi:MAG TPA: HU family DNA-binding protein [Longimicrobium sp.]|nr:HU family DNA-binding protein [Longimicrobium sp.]
MTRAELVARVAARAGLTLADAEKAVDALFRVDGGIIASAVACGEAVRIAEFGSFEPRPGRPPSSRDRGGAGEGAPPPAPVFRAGSGWLDGGERMRGGPGKPPKGTRGSASTGSTGPRRDSE